ncbi:MAG TPA: hypothetical protein VMT75_03680 [Candidatus Saccharimonadales bacterium]|nr:hypothetical protein [Candidatus Saccharimonadales bacterium]
MKIGNICKCSMPWLLALISVAFLTPVKSPGAEPPSEAAITLRDILMAACSHNAAQFKAHLTARNAAAFSRLAPAAQVTLLKRFVLLDNTGTPNAELNEKGEITVSCVTDQVTTQMLIGRAEIRESLAFLPLVVRESTDTAGTGARRIQMGLVKENGEWRLLSLGLLLLDLPSLGEEWDRAEIDPNEKSALASMKELQGAIEKYRVTYTRLPDSLSVLGPPAKGTPSIDEAGLVSAELASGKKDGYTFRYVIVGANNSGAPAKYELAGMPVTYGRTGTTSYFLDSSGTFHSGDHRGAVGTAADPKVE